MKKISFFLTFMTIALVINAQENFKDVTSDYTVYTKGETVSLVKDCTESGDLSKTPIDLQSESKLTAYDSSGHTSVIVPTHTYCLGSEKLVGINKNVTLNETTMSLLLSKSVKNHPYFFIQITDPQFGMFENNNGFEKETVLYENAVVKINR